MTFKDWLAIHEDIMASTIIDRGLDGAYLASGGKKYGPLADLLNQGGQWVARKMDGQQTTVQFDDPHLAPRILQAWQEIKARQDKQRQERRGPTLDTSKLNRGSMKTLWRGLAGKYRPFDSQQAAAYNKPQSFGTSPTMAWNYALKVTKNAAAQGKQVSPSMIQIRVPTKELPAPHNTSGTIYDIPAEKLPDYGVRELDRGEVEQLLSNERRFFQ